LYIIAQFSAFVNLFIAGFVNKEGRGGVVLDWLVSIVVVWDNAGWWYSGRIMLVKQNSGISQIELVVIKKFFY